MTLTRSRLIEAMACAVYHQAKDRSDAAWHKLHPEAMAIYIDATRVALRTGAMGEMTFELASILGFVRPNEVEVSD